MHKFKFAAAGAIVGVGLVVAGDVSAHAPSSSVSCDGVTLTAVAYEDNPDDLFRVVFDGAVVFEDVDGFVDQSYTHPVPQDGVAHSYTLTIVEHSGDPAYQLNESGTVGQCGGSTSSTSTTTTLSPTSTTTEPSTTTTTVPDSTSTTSSTTTTVPSTSTPSTIGTTSTVTTAPPSTSTTEPSVPPSSASTTLPPSSSDSPTTTTMSTSTTSSPSTPPGSSVPTSSTSLPCTPPQSTPPTSGGSQPPTTQRLPIDCSPPSLPATGSSTIVIVLAGWFVIAVGAALIVWPRIARRTR